MIFHTYLPMKVEQTGCSKTLGYKIQTPRDYPEESIQQVNSDVRTIMLPFSQPIFIL